MFFFSLKRLISNILFKGFGIFSLKFVLNGNKAKHKVEKHLIDVKASQGQNSAILGNYPTFEQTSLNTIANELRSEGKKTKRHFLVLETFSFISPLSLINDLKKQQQIEITFHDFFFFF